MDSLKRTLDYAERAFVALLSLPYLISFAIYSQAHPFVLAVVASEMLSVFFIVTRRAGVAQLRAYAWAVGLAGAALPLLARPGNIELAQAWLTTPLMVGGLLISVWAKISLNRSFGAVAANRGIKIGGPYRFVRHPMYLGYFVSQVGFLLTAFSWYLFAIFGAAWLVQVLRILEEERVLLMDPAYREMAKRVPRRVLPGF